MTEEVRNVGFVIGVGVEELQSPLLFLNAEPKWRSLRRDGQSSGQDEELSIGGSNGGDKKAVAGAELELDVRFILDEVVFRFNLQKAKFD